MIGYLLEFLVLRVLARLFPSRYRLIPREGDGAPLLRQFKVFSFGAEKPRGEPPWWHFSCYLQSFAREERPNRYHVHRWRHMRSFVLSGQFSEELYPTGIYEAHCGLSTYTMNDTHVHRLAYVAPRTWTLFFMFGCARHALEGGWGYFSNVPSQDRLPFHPGNYTPWDQQIPEPSRIAPL